MYMRTSSLFFIFSVSCLRPMKNFNAYWLQTTDRSMDDGVVAHSYRRNTSKRSMKTSPKNMICLILHQNVPSLIYMRKSIIKVLYSRVERIDICSSNIQVIRERDTVKKNIISVTTTEQRFLDQMSVWLNWRECIYRRHITVTKMFQC